MNSLSLAGVWAFALDREERGISEGWFLRNLPSEQHAELPGSLAVQGAGDDVTLETAWTGTIFNRLSFESPEYAPYREPANIKFPFWLQPEKVYVGGAWFQREIEIPEDWVGKRIVLTFERAHWFTHVWLDEREIGAGDSLSAPHRFDLGGHVSAGLHRLTIRVDNRLHVAVGENAHSVSDHTQGNWNGIIGRIELSAHERALIEDLQVFPNVATRTVAVRGLVKGMSSGGVELCVEQEESNARHTKLVSISADGSFTADIPLGDDAPLWDEFAPALWQLTARLSIAGAGNESVRPAFSQDSNLNYQLSTTFGLREIATESTEFRLNGRPVFFRGTLECCIFPLTGHPPMDVESWRRALQVVKEHGLNHVRFHSWCPPEAAFLAGDELGVYFQIEAATWPNAVAVEAGQSPAGIGDGKAVDDWVYAETVRILREYGNHPCFVLMAAGNEPGGPHHAQYLNEWVRHFRRADPRRLFTSTAGWPEVEENQFHVIPEPRGHQWLDGLRSRLNATPPATVVDYRESMARRKVPVISHEIGQWCSYPPLNDAGKFTGHLKARNYEIFAETLAAAGMSEQLDAFVHASGKLQALCYKEEIESALRTPGMGGFQLLDLRDFPGQGTAPVGVLNVFWESKGYITPEEFRRFCAPTVLLARLPKRVFTSGETLHAAIEAAHFGPAALEDAAISWRLHNLSDAGAVIGSGTLPPTRIPFGAGVPLGQVSIPLAAISAPVHCRLIVQIERTPIANDWDIWIYPDELDDASSDDVSVFQTWDSRAEEILTRGGKLLLVLPQSSDNPAPIEFGFTPIFWNTWCTKRQAPHTLGILCNPEHPALSAFPTDSHTNWHWWYLVRHASAMILDRLPRGLRPIIQVIDDWQTNHRLGLLFEARVGSGRLVVSSIDFVNPGNSNPVLRQLRSSVLRYMRSGHFTPAIAVDAAELRELIP